MLPSVKKIVLVVLSILLLAIGGGFSLLLSKPDIPVADIAVADDPALVERGRYLANHVTVCVDCHSTRDWNAYSGPIKPGTEGMGGERFGPEFGFPGLFYSRNITPAALADWSDGEIARAVTSGVSRDGQAFFPVMPYPAYRYMSTKDLHAIVAYVRTLPAVANEVPASAPDFPMNLILRTIPAPAAPLQPDANDSTAYGKYLVTIAACAECHTPAEKGEKLPGMDLAGGFKFPLPAGGFAYSSNITPDPDTGIGNWTREQFIGRFKAYGRPDAAYPVAAGAKNTVMPWTMYAGMTAADLGAIYDYLRTVPAVRNAVKPFEP